MIVFHAKTVHQIKILVQGASGPVLVWSAASGAFLWPPSMVSDGTRSFFPVGAWPDSMSGSG